MHIIFNLQTYVEHWENRDFLPEQMREANWVLDTLMDRHSPSDFDYDAGEDYPMIELHEMNPFLIGRIVKLSPDDFINSISLNPLAPLH